MPNINFRVVDKECREYPLVKSTFSKLIQPVYGSQEAALDKIGKGHDRLCEVMFDDDAPKGLLVYKKAAPNHELELKTLCLCDPEKDGKQGYGRILMQRLQETAYQRGADKIKMSVSSQRGEAKQFFLKNGFVERRQVKGIYRPADTEYFLSKTLEPDYSYKRARVERPAARAGARDERPAARANASDHPAQHTPALFQPRQRILTCTLKDKYVRYIGSGRKTHEGRVATSMFNGYRQGDIVKWFANDVSVWTEIKSVRRFRSFDDMVRALGHQALVPDAGSQQHAISIYNGIPGYADKAQRFGVLAFELRVLSAEEVQRAQQQQQASNQSEAGHKRSRANFN